MSMITRLGRAGTGFNGHIADAHAALHRQATNGTATEFNGIARAPSRANLSDDGQHDILGRDARTQFAIDRNEHRLGLVHQKTDRKSTRLNSSHPSRSRMPSSA